jgi:AcrR family transcriptional regulator
MGMPVGHQTRGESVHTRLLDAAETLFHRDGVHRTGVDAVLAEAGVSPATLYAHFGGKDGLVTSYLQRRLERWRTVWAEAVDAAASPEGRLLAVFDALEHFRVDQPYDRGCAFLAAASELPADHPAMEVVRADTDYLRERLRALARDLPVADPDALAEQVQLAYDGALSGYLRPGTTDASARGRALAALAVRSAVAQA